MTAYVVAILGPTASGKSEVAQLVAERLDGEVISADSMQVYRGMDIGTAKIPQAQRRVVHHLIDILDPGEPYSVQQFQQQARYLFDDIDSRGKVPVLCGGTGLYVQASLEAYEFPSGELSNNEIRDRYEEIARTQGANALWSLLNDTDPASAALIHPNNIRRVVRALEMHDQGISYARQVEGMKELPEVVPSLRFGLKRDPTMLAERIDQRVDAMFDQGLVREVKGLIDSGFRDALTAPQAIGYKEVVAALDGDSSLDEAREQIKIATRRYAKRQRSWLRRDSRLRELDADSLAPDELCETIVKAYRSFATMD